MVELLPSTLLNLASGPQIAVTKTATHMAVIASDAHISGISRSDHRGRSVTARDGSRDIVDISYTPLHCRSSARGAFEAIRVAPDRDSVKTALASGEREDGLNLPCDLVWVEGSGGEF